MDGEAGWWTTSGNIGLPPLARVMGVGRQKQQQSLNLKQWYDQDTASTAGLQAHGIRRTKRHLYWLWSFTTRRETLRIYGGIRWDRFMSSATLTTGILTYLTMDLIIANNNNRPRLKDKQQIILTPCLSLKIFLLLCLLQIKTRYQISWSGEKGYGFVIFGIWFNSRKYDILNFFSFKLGGWWWF